MRLESPSAFPFRGEIIGRSQSNFTQDIFRFRSNQAVDYVLRSNLTHGSMEAEREYQKAAKEEFRVLGTHGVSVIGHSVVLVRSENGPSTQMVTIADYVRGGSMWDAPKKDIDKLIFGLVDYYEEKAMDPKLNFLVDISDAPQYMYGSVGCEKPRIYLVDVEFRVHGLFRPPKPFYFREVVLGEEYMHLGSMSTFSEESIAYLQQSLSRIKDEKTQPVSEVLLPSGS